MQKQFGMLLIPFDRTSIKELKEKDKYSEVGVDPSVTLDKTKDFSASRDGLN